MNYEDFLKLLLSDNPSHELDKNKDELFKFIPEFKKCYKFEQNNEWHVYDVYEHTLHVIDNVSNDIVMRLSAFFHDIGKPLVYTEDENKTGHFKGHWIESQKIFDEFARKNKIDEKIRKLVSKLIYYHDVRISKQSDEEINNLLKEFDNNELNKLYELKRADLLGQNHKYHYYLEEYKKELENLIKRRGKQ